MTPWLQFFDRVWVLDFEFSEPPGHPPKPWCGVSQELLSGEVRIWRHDDPTSPILYTTGARDLVIAYAAEAEGKCILTLGWTPPSHTIDLLPVYRRQQNTMGAPVKSSLLSALESFGIPHIPEADKQEWRNLAIRGAPFTEEEMTGLLRYCQSDVQATAQLARRLADSIPLPYALLWGRFTMRAVAAMELLGVPVDAPLLCQLRENWARVRSALITDVDSRYGVFRDGSFNHELFGAYLSQHEIAWPRTPSGRLCVDDDTFKEMAELHPQLRELRELLKTLNTCRTFSLTVGTDGRNRTSLMPFSSITGRNQPSTSKFIFGLPRWMRSLIIPPPGKALIELDFAQEEFLIAAVLSDDRRMLEAYRSGDPYMHTAILAGAAPPGATKVSHPDIRNLFKTAVLAIQYGCGAEALGKRLGNPNLGTRLLSDHKRVYKTYWAWSDQQVDRLALHGVLMTPYAWQIQRSSGGSNPRSVVNWPTQAAGADIMRLASMAMVEHGIEVAAPIHDAFLVVAAEDAADAVADSATSFMKEASAAVLCGHECNVTAAIIRPGERYNPSGGCGMFHKVISLLQALHCP